MHSAASNPLDETISVLTWGKRSYRTHGVFRSGQAAVSIILPGFSIAVDEVFSS